MLWSVLRTALVIFNFEHLHTKCFISWLASILLYLQLYIQIHYTVLKNATKSVYFFNFAESHSLNNWVLTVCPDCCHPGPHKIRFISRLASILLYLQSYIFMQIHYTVLESTTKLFFYFAATVKVNLLTVCPNCCHFPGPHSRHERLRPEQGAADLAPHCQREGQCWDSFQPVASLSFPSFLLSIPCTVGTLGLKENVC